MTRRRLVFAALACSGALMATGLSGQSGSPSTRNGEWPQYAADARGTRYSPLDQITASNFNKLEVAWRFKTDNLGTAPEFKLEGTPLMVAACSTRPPARAARWSRSTRDR